MFVLRRQTAERGRIEAASAIIMLSTNTPASSLSKKSVHFTKRGKLYCTATYQTRFPSWIPSRTTCQSGTVSRIPRPKMHPWRYNDPQIKYRLNPRTWGLQTAFCTLFVSWLSIPNKLECARYLNFISPIAVMEAAINTKISSKSSDESRYISIARPKLNSTV